MQTDSIQAAPPKLLTPREVQALLKCQRNYVYVLMRDKGFPKPMHLSKRCRRWEADKVYAWINDRLAGESGAAK